MKIKQLLSASVICSALLLAGCGNGAANSNNLGTLEGTASTPSASTSATTESKVPAPTTDALPQVDGDFGQTPVIHPSTQEPPKELVVKVLKKGDGPVVSAKDTVSVNYQGVLWNGQAFDGSFGSGQPISFPLTGVIPGWTQGLSNQTVGSRVLLVIPPELGYGEQGSGDRIPPNSTLVFVVDILDKTDAEKVAAEAKKQQEAQAELQKKITEAIPQAVESGKQALKNGELQTLSLPQGVTFKNNPEGAPELSIKTEEKFAEPKFFLAVKGAGEVIPEDKQSFVHVTGSDTTGAKQTTWDDPTHDVQIFPPLTRLGLPFKGVTYGSRVLVVATHQGKNIVSTYDFLAPVPEAGK
ncbi:hypothetical protein BSR29_08275 [Boudabousia liubingyangii]|uniref:peptidylprolyl isomerase n=1 Tax=Boudabousia liubingyangii TaxID=1921764 RepID=A0A1Q5PJF3_9ACTO|nr:FKBP-type peptidyl-prolyl cis-trans isomerase [Boudabousia liubingyangii]OKL45968.1 hypothetical protein BSR29_08275 [Boudabousia liubingyangii]OKL47756.1 hypothetical protein BSR28_04555 [Boudabousia liubingyangii]